MRRLLFKICALGLSVLMLLSFVACDNNTGGGESSEPSSPEDLSSAETSSTEKTEQTDVEKLLDGNAETFWLAPSGTSSIELSLDAETEFNAIIFDEYNSYITDYFVEIKSGDEWKQVYRQDEMGVRTGILDETVKAKDIRLTVTTSDEQGGLKDIAFVMKERMDAKGFRNVGYYTVSRLEKMRETDFGELKDLTDIILFDFGSWDKNGDFLWGSMGGYDEAFLADALAEIKTALGGRDINIWFCLQNYNKESTKNTGELFATEASRKKLTKFSVDICKKYGFAGVDIDYEYPWFSKEYTDIAWENYSKFLVYASNELHKNGYELSTALYPSRVQLSAEAIKAIDYVNVMSYDMMDSAGRHSPYSVCRESLDYFTGLGFKSEQLVLGLPYYTKTTTGEAGPGYYWIVSRWRNAVKNWTNFSYTNQYTYYFNGPDILRDKTYFAMENNMAGVFNWCMGTDVDRSDSRSLAKRVAETITRFSK